MAWSSVTIKQGGKVLVKHKVVKCEREAVLGDLLQNKYSMSKACVKEVKVCHIPKFTDHVDSVPLDAPLPV